jgi:lysophospholipase L1-like esterase
MNVEAAKGKTDLDVLLLGDSITEGWHGTSRGHEIARAQGASSIFRKYFDGEGTDAKYEGLAIGISGDTSPNLLWRMQNGELPDALNPKVIWLLIGTNDFGKTWCSPELVLIGIMRVIEELRVLKPEATIVVNGLLPRSFHRKGYVMRGRPSFLGRKPSLPSLWRDIVAVNDELRQYSTSRDKVEYFETDIFFLDKKTPREELRINNQLMPDRLHPSAEGYDLWGEQIVSTLDRLIGNR